MPFWGEAISTERDVAKKVQALAPLEPDPLLREAIALQGYEEGRHSALLDEMLRHYDIPMPRSRRSRRRGDPLWNFMRVGYGECFDSFFAFGLYMLARDSGLFPPALLKTMEPIVQEEARHILFFVNWIAYCRARQPAPQRLLHRGRCMLAMTVQVWTRVKTAVAAARGGDDDGGATKTTSCSGSRTRSRSSTRRASSSRSACARTIAGWRPTTRACCARPSSRPSRAR